METFEAKSTYGPRRRWLVDYFEVRVDGVMDEPDDEEVAIILKNLIEHLTEDTNG